MCLLGVSLMSGKGAPSLGQNNAFLVHFLVDTVAHKVI